MFTEERIPHHLDRTSPIPTDPIYDKCVKTYDVAQANNRRSPIPKDPTYSDPSDYKMQTPKPRVKPEALNIARNHQGKDLAYLFNPAFKIIPIGVKQSHRTSRDHEKENYKKIKEIQRANKEKQDDSSRSRTPVKAVYKADKYGHVQSKVAQHIQTPLAPRNTTPTSKLQRSSSASNIERTSNNKEHSNNKSEGLTVQSARSSPKWKLNESSPSDNKSKRPSSAMGTPVKENERASQRRPQRPSSACEIEIKKNQPLSHIALNKQAIQKTKLRRDPSHAALQELHAKKENEITQYRRGSIPKYLRNRQTEWKKAEEERIANLPDPTVPLGHTVMTEDERTRTLTLLQKSQRDMIEELKSLPLSRDTMRVKNRKDLLERKLTEIDTALKIFSRPRVFIKDE